MSNSINIGDMVKALENQIESCEVDNWCGGISVEGMMGTFHKQALDNLAIAIAKYSTKVLRYSQAICLMRNGINVTEKDISKAIKLIESNTVKDLLDE